MKLFLSGLKYTDPRTTNLRFIFWKPCNCNPLARNLRLPSIHYPLSIFIHPGPSTYHLLSSRHFDISTFCSQSTPTFTTITTTTTGQPTNFHFSQDLLHIYPYQSFLRQRQIIYASLSLRTHYLSTNEIKVKNIELRLIKLPTKRRNKSHQSSEHPTSSIPRHLQPTAPNFSNTKHRVNIECLLS